MGEWEDGWREGWRTREWIFFIIINLVNEINPHASQRPLRPLKRT